MQTYFLFFTSIVVWGSTWIAIKFQITDVDPMVSVLYRYVIASFILFIFCVLKKKKLFVYSKKDHFFMALLGLFLFSINYWLVYVAEQDITSGLISVLYSGMVFMNIFNGFIFIKSKIEPRMIIGGLVGISGIVLIFLPEVNAFSFTERELWGLVLGIVSVYIASIGNIISARNTANGIPVLVSNTFGMAYGALIMLLLSLFSGCDYVIPLNFSYLASLFYLAIFGSVIAFGTYLTLVGKVGAAKASYAIMIVPVVALGFSTLFEGFEWTVEAFMGLVLVLSGNIFLVNKGNRIKSVDKVPTD